MNNDLEPLTPPMRLALIHAHPEGREILEFMLQMDRRIGSILARTSETLIGQMRIAWWRDIIGKPVEKRPSGEPMIAWLNDLEMKGRGRLLLPAIVQLLNAWETVIANRNWNEEQLIGMSEIRGAGIFCTYVAAAGYEPEERLIHWATRWALADLGSFCSDPELHDMVIHCHVPGKGHIPGQGKRLPSIFRPAGILAHAAEGRGRLVGFRLLWHALTGK